MFVATVTAPLRPAWATIMRLLLVVLRVQDVVLDAAAVQQPGELLGLLDRDGADEDRLARLVPLDDVVDHGVPLRVFVLVDQVLLVLADHRPVRGDLDDADLVGLLELGELRLRRSRHARRACRTS